MSVTPANQNASAKKMFWRMLGFLRPFKTMALISCALLIARILVEVACVYFLSPILTTITANLNDGSGSVQIGFWTWLTSGAKSAHDLRRVLGSLALVQASLGILIYLRATRDAKLSMKLISSMRAAMYDHLQHLGFSFYDRMSSGKLMNRAIGDLETIHGFINLSVLASLDIIVSVAAYLALLCWRSPYLLFAALIPLPIWCLVVFRFSKKATPLYKVQQQAQDSLLGAITENCEGKHVVRAFRSFNFESAKFEKRNQNLLGHFLAVVRFQAVLTPALQCLAIAAHILVFLVCSYLIQLKVLPIGDLLILGGAIAAILAKLAQISTIAETYQRALVSGERFFEVLDSKTLLATAKGMSSLAGRDAGGDIVFENVSFSYDEAKQALRNLNCTIRGGEVTALVGPTGSGKSTLSALIARFYDCATGRITIGGQDIAQLNLKELRHHVGFVFQETFLFSDTIRNNICYGRGDVNDEMMIAAARWAHAHEFIERLEVGYDTKLGEGGLQLSGGQRQRLALARALVYNPEVLILDDAMASLDASTEAAIREGFKEIFEGRTVLLITHSPASLGLANRVLHIQDGSIVDGAPRFSLRDSGQVSGLSLIEEFA